MRFVYVIQACPLYTAVLSACYIDCWNSAQQTRTYSLHAVGRLAFATDSEQIAFVGFDTAVVAWLSVSSLIHARQTGEKPSVFSELTSRCR